MTGRKYKVTVADAAEDDLFDIVGYVLMRERDIAPAVQIQERIEKTIASLSRTAKRGRVPPELRDIGTEQLGFDFRELIEWPWRIVYRIRGQSVHVVIVLDGRRDAGDRVRERAIRFLTSDEE